MQMKWNEMETTIALDIEFTFALSSLLNYCNDISMPLVPYLNGASYGTKQFTVQQLTAFSWVYNYSYNTR